jgi:Ca2+-binding EF-hand superfamily protein
MFKDADTDSSGFLDRSEVKQLLIKHAGVEDLDEDAVEKYFMLADTNQDGKIDHWEFMRHIADATNMEKIISPKVLPIYREQGLPAKQFATLYLSFTDADDDRNGVLDKEEVRELLAKSANTEDGRHVPEEELECYFSRADANKDGKIDLKEFLDAVRGTGSHES